MLNMFSLYRDTTRVRQNNVVSVSVVDVSNNNPTGRDIKEVRKCDRKTTKREGKIVKRDHERKFTFYLLQF